MFSRRGASAHRCQGPQLLHIVRGGGHHTHGGTNGHRESAACDLESDTVPLQHMVWCMVLGCGAAGAPCGLLGVLFCLNKDLNVSKPSNQSKGLGGNNGCRDKNSTWYLKGSPIAVTLGQQCNVGEKPTVTLYTSISHHVGTPKSRVIVIQYFWTMSSRLR